MSGIALGINPDTIRVHLTTGADFDAVFRLSTPWPSGSSLSLVFDGGTTWAATISGTDATFDVDKATADAIGDKTKVQVKYVNGTTDQTWYAGTVVRHG